MGIRGHINAGGLAYRARDSVVDVLTAPRLSRRRFTLLCAASGLVLLAGRPIRAGVPSADEIIASHIEALGGAKRLKTIRSLRRSGHLAVPGFSADLNLRDSAHIAYIETRLRPASIRQDETLQGLHQITAFDGRDGWKIRAFAGEGDPERMSADEMRGIRLAADFNSPLHDYRAKGHRVEFLGQDDLDGTPTYLLRVELAWGDQTTYWIDTDTLMVLRERDRQTVRGAVQVTDTDFSEYEQVNGVWVAMTEERGPQDSDPSRKQKIVYAKAEANVPLDPTIFAFPTAHAAKPPS